MKRAFFVLSLVAVVLNCAPIAFGASVASDDASKSAYDDGWSAGDNGGTGFGNWTLSTGSNSGRFIGNSDISVGGKSWGLWANSGDTSSAVRPFTVGGLNNDATLAAGESFSIAIELGSIDTGGTVGFSLQNSLGNNRIELYFIGGQSEFTVNVAGSPSVQIGTGVGWSNTGIQVTYTQLSSNAWTMQVGATTVASGTNPVSASDISQVRLFNYNAGAGLEGVNDQFFNSMSVVPEPSTILMLTAASAVLIARRRRW